MDRIPRFYLEKLSDNISIEDRQVGHIKNSIRLKQDDQIIVFDGKGKKARYNIDLLTKKRITASIVQKLKVKIPEKKIILIQSLINFKKFEEIVKRTIPLGVTSIIPLETQYSLVKLKDLNNKKYKRLNKIAIEECKQSGRDILPFIHKGITFDQLNQFTAYDQNLIATTKSKSNLKKNINNDKQSFSIMIGPEGDFTDDELKIAKDMGFLPVSIHDNILRTELASVYAVSVLSFI